MLQLIALICLLPLSLQASTIIGGYTPIDTDSPTAKEMALDILNEINKEAGGEKYELRQVISAEEQLVAGMNYKFKLLISLVDCKVLGCDKTVKGCVFVSLNGHKKVDISFSSEESASASAQIQESD